MVRQMNHLASVAYPKSKGVHPATFLEMKFYPKVLDTMEWLDSMKRPERNDHKKFLLIRLPCGVHCKRAPTCENVWLRRLPVVQMWRRFPTAQTFGCASSLSGSANVRG